LNTEFQFKIVRLLLQKGFSSVGFSHAEPVDESWSDKLANWIKSGHHAGMKWIEKNAEKRSDPTLLHPGTRTIITMLHPWPKTSFDTTEIKIAAYAHGNDYHEYLSKQAEAAMNLISESDPDFTPVFISDSASVFDRYWALKAGLGFIGKNGFLINRELGSRFLIAHIFTSIGFEPSDNGHTLTCNNCTKCIDSCPTGAFNENGTIDARKCIAYWNIESKESIPISIADKNPGWIYGCDICQQVCPHNQKEVAFEASERMSGKWNAPTTAEEWLKMDENEFQSHFANTPLKRTGLEKIKRTLMQLSNKY